MANCLGETHLDLVVPGLRLAAKGKVSGPPNCSPSKIPEDYSE
jgi:hypothetical protein